MTKSKAGPWCRNCLRFWLNRGLFHLGRFGVTVQCGRARSHIPAGVNPAPARQASHWIEDPGPAGVIPKVKHRAIKTTGRKRKLK
jgi:hypothetical protein